MPTKIADIVAIGNDTYFQYNGQSSSSWPVLIRKDGNETAYLPVYMRLWDDTQQLTYDRLTLFPAPGCGEAPLLQMDVRPQTKKQGSPNSPTDADTNTFPDILLHCRMLPASVHWDSAHQRILIALLCTLEAQPENHQTVVKLPAHDEIRISQDQEAIRVRRRKRGTVLSLMEAMEQQLLALATQPGETEYFYPIAAKMFLGLQALHERAFAKAEDHFRTAVGFDRADYSEEEEWFDDAKKKPETAEERDRRRTRAPFELEEDHYRCGVFDAEEETFFPGTYLLSAVFCFLREEYHECLKTLRQIPSPPPMFPTWAIAFWKALAFVELGRYREAKRWLFQATVQKSPVESIPPVLLHPLLWSWDRHPTFFTSEVQLLLAQHLPQILSRMSAVTMASDTLWLEGSDAGAKKREGL